MPLSSVVSLLVQAVVPLMLPDSLVTISLATTRLVIPALAPVSLNSTGTGGPTLKIELPSGRMGERKNVPSPGAWYWTQTVNVALAVLALLSDAVQVTVVLPGAKVVPDAGAQVTARTPSTASVAVGAA